MDDRDLHAGSVTETAETGHTDDAPRDCGGCNVCCTAMRVTPLNKPAGDRCEHQTATGCGIYRERPEVCRTWFCLWVRDNGRVLTDAERPDRLGLFFTATRPDPATGEQAIVAHEVRPDASRERRARRVIEMLGRVAPVRLATYTPPSNELVALTVNGEGTD